MQEKATNICVYSGPGVGERSLKNLLATLESVRPEANIEIINAVQVRESKCFKRSSLFIMPGGRDIPYCESLNGAGTKAIKEYIQSGGRYLGLCAGAYFACESISFEVGTPNEVVGKRELAFFKGVGIGSALKPGSYSYMNEVSAGLAEITDKAGTLRNVYFDGGCYFEGDDNSCEVLYRYAAHKDRPPAIIFLNYGKGQVLLSGVHPEFLYLDSQTLRPDLATKLMRHEFENFALCDQLLTKLGL